MNLVKSNLCKNCTSSNRGQKENTKNSITEEKDVMVKVVVNLINKNN